MTNFNRSGGGPGSGAAPLISWQNPEDGLVYRRLYTGLPSAHTVGEAERIDNALPEGPVKDAYHSKVVALRDEITNRATSQALEFGARAMTEVASASHLTVQQTRRVEEAVTALRDGTMTTDAAADLYDTILREQRAVSAQINAWRSGAKRAANNFADPLGAHDRLVNRLPVLRSRPLL